MANFNKTFQEEVRRLARKEVKDATQALKSENLKLKKTVAHLKRRIDQLEGAIKRSKTAAVTAPQIPGAPAAATPRPRITGKTVRALRERLQLTQAEFGKLLGVSGQSVYQWERRDDRLRLRHATTAAFLAAREMGVREAREQVSKLK